MDMKPNGMLVSCWLEACWWNKDGECFMCVRWRSCRRKAAALEGLLVVFGDEVFGWDRLEVKG